MYNPWYCMYVPVIPCRWIWPNFIIIKCAYFGILFIHYYFIGSWTSLLGPVEKYFRTIFYATRIRDRTTRIKWKKTKETWKAKKQITKCKALRHKIIFFLIKLYFCYNYLLHLLYTNYNMQYIDIVYKLHVLNYCI